jgi:hypothetical protein
MVERRLGLTISVGITTYDPAAHGPISADAILETADQALRESKASGRDRVTYRILPVAEPVAPDEELAEAPEDEEESGATRYR